jgi:phosphoribosylanthranilate isomerase
MALSVKICGLSTPETVAAAVSGGARYVGFVFFPPSPRALTAAAAAALAALVPTDVHRVGLFVDATDAVIGAVLATVDLDMVQLHGCETPGRAAEVRARFGVPVIKAVPVDGSADLDRARAYEGAADWLLFDAHPPPGATRPGGNASAFDWTLMAGRRWSVPWMLAGGLTAETVTDAVRLSGADAVDVSSGVEEAPGVKSVARIRDFLKCAGSVGAAAGMNSAGER